jgi:uncharacterized protein YcbX
MLTVSELYIYPIKSIGGISVPLATLTDRGFTHDRRWMLVDENNRFLSQRELPQMALLQSSFDKKNIVVTHKISGEKFSFDITQHSGEIITVTIWDDSCPVLPVSHAANEWFSDTLKTNCKLVYMPDYSQRLVEAKYASDGEITSLSDGYPLLIIGQSSLDDLNERLQEKLLMDRFRPNIVFTGGTPYQEDDLKHFRIGSINLFGVKPCARCPITTTNQQTAERSKEPLKTLATYRQRNNNVYFGQNVLYKGNGEIAIGDEIENLENVIM